MPTYEYACSKCDNHWEEVQRITEPPVVVCPKCHKKSAQRQISGGSFILKGGGWYAEGYSSAKPAKAEANGTTTTETKAESKSETPAKKDSVAPAPAKESKSPSTAPSSGTSSSGTKSSGGTKD